ncbi:MAG TPA: DAK2 domain-containing protein [Dehalococcoidia bacterium]|nr:DAK2 domain-containing protein [Dehalococcoidia bacterium]
MSASATPRGSAPHSRPAPDPPLGGAELRRAFAGASAWLERNAAAIDAINVYPVPDGDTGANMAATLRDALTALPAGAAAAGAVAAALARSALLSARGNSGVILSQWLGGFAEAAAGTPLLDGAALARALTGAAERAYAALREPTEGTILSVARGAAEAAGASPDRGPIAVFDAALAGARAALERTPEQLPVLREAGVVDAGGFGLVVLLEGLLAALRGTDLSVAPHSPQRPAADWLDAARAGGQAGHNGFGYCTQFVLNPVPPTLDSLQAELERLGDSVIVAPADGGVRVHVHTADPGAALTFGTAMGSLTRISIENMQAQFERFAAQPAAQALAGGQPPEVPAEDAVRQQTAVVAVLSGAGLVEVARSLGASAIVAGGATANPAVDEMLAAIRTVPSENVIVLPNQKNVVLAAEQAAQLAEKRAIVLPTRSAAQGLAVLAAFRPERPLDTNLDAMRDALDGVRTIEITRAARAARLHGESVPRGRPIALLDGRLAAAADTPAAALLAAIKQIGPPDGAALTLYSGEGVAPSESAAAAETIAASMPGLDVQLLDGGQPHYDYIAALE